MTTPKLQPGNQPPIYEKRKKRNTAKPNTLTQTQQTLTQWQLSCVDPCQNRLRRLDEELLVVLDASSKQILKFDTNKVSLTFEAMRAKKGCLGLNEHTLVFRFLAALFG